MIRPGLGWQKDDHDSRDKPASQLLRAATGAPLPESIRNDDLVKVVNQGGLGSCTANAAGQAVRAAVLLEVVELKRSQWVAEHGSEAGFDAAAALAKAREEVEFWARLMMYFLGRAYQGQTAEDTGTQIRLIFRAANHYGYAPESAWTYDDDARTRVGKFAKMPPANAFRLAFDQRDNKANRDANMIDYARIESTGSARIRDIKTALSQRHLVVFGTLVTEEFCSDGSAHNGAPIPRPNDDADFAGGHALCLGGYGPDGGEVINSWGEGWGGQGGLPPGWCRFSWDYLTWERTTDLWIVRRAPFLPKADA